MHDLLSCGIARVRWSGPPHPAVRLGPLGSSVWLGRCSDEAGWPDGLGQTRVKQKGCLGFVQVNAIVMHLAHGRGIPFAGCEAVSHLPCATRGTPNQATAVGEAKASVRRDVRWLSRGLDCVDGWIADCDVASSASAFGGNSPVNGCFGVLCLGAGLHRSVPTDEPTCADA